MRFCLEGLLPTIIYIDLVGKEKEDARTALLTGVKRGRQKPTQEPKFPEPEFPEVTRRSPIPEPSFPAPMVDVEIIKPHDSFKRVRIRALVDTGSSMSFIDQETIASLGLLPIRQARVTGLMGITNIPIYIVDVSLGRSALSGIEVGSVPSLTGCMIGRDVLSLGKVAITF